MSILDRKIMVVDLEATSKFYQSAAIIELGVCGINDGKMSKPYSKLVNQGLRVPDEVTMLTGITNEMIADATPLRDTIRSFSKLIKDSILVVHNADYDIPVL